MTPLLNFGGTFTHLVNAMSQMTKINLTVEQIDLNRREEKKCTISLSSK